jgi:hypothetical protein
MISRFLDNAPAVIQKLINYPLIFQKRKKGSISALVCLCVVNMYVGCIWEIISWLPNQLHLDTFVIFHSVTHVHVSNMVEISYG